MNKIQINHISHLLKSDSYQGRGIILGKTQDGIHGVAIYFIMGRSENSRNRVFVKEEKFVKIIPFDEEKVEDPSLIIYYPIRFLEDKLIVTNGDQTDTIYDYISMGKTFEEGINTRSFEPDFPNFTPRISGLLDYSKEALSYKLSILKAGDDIGEACNRYFFNYEAVAGFGHFIHTYEKNSEPLQTFMGEPRRIYMPNDYEGLGEEIWRDLNEDNKISMVIKGVHLKTGLISTKIFNKHIR